MVLEPIESAAQGGAASTEHSRAERALEHDLRMIIRQQTRMSWVSDRSALEESAERLLESGCLASESVRASLLASLRGRAREKGASAAERWRAGEALSALSEQLILERLVAALEWIATRASECPFWIEARADSLGLHQDQRRWQLILESMGGLQVVFRGGARAIGGAGQGRILGSYGFGERWGLALGAELGGASLFPRGEDGDRRVQATWIAGLPLLWRLWLKDYRFDIEAALIARLPDQLEGAPLWGFRVAPAFGLSTPRISSFLPHFYLWAGYEQLQSGEHSMRIFRVGSRVGVSWGGAATLDSSRRE